MSLTNCELLRSPVAGESPVVVCDAPARAVRALRDALGHLRRIRYSCQLDAAAVLALRELIDLADRIPDPDGADMHVLRVSRADAVALADAAALYVAERDTESYQPPQERERIAALRELDAPLRDMLGRLMLAELDAQQPALA